MFSFKNTVFQSVIFIPICCGKTILTYIHRKFTIYMNHVDLEKYLNQLNSILKMVWRLCTIFWFRAVSKKFKKSYGMYFLFISFWKMIQIKIYITISFNLIVKLTLKVAFVANWDSSATKRTRFDNWKYPDSEYQLLFSNWPNASTQLNCLECPASNHAPLQKDNSNIAFLNYLIVNQLHVKCPSCKLFVNQSVWRYKEKANRIRWKIFILEKRINLGNVGVILTITFETLTTNEFECYLLALSVFCSPNRSRNRWIWSLAWPCSGNHFPHAG